MAATMSSQALLRMPRYDLPGPVRRGKIRYRLTEPAATTAPWSVTITSDPRAMLGSRDGHMDMLAGSLTKRITRDNYDSGMRKFAAFCVGGRHQLPRCHYVENGAVHGMAGTTDILSAYSLHQCFSSVNKHFRDHQRQPVALGDVLAAAARRGLELQQECLGAEVVRVPAPAPGMSDVLDALVKLRPCVQWRPGTIAELRHFRGSMASTTYYFFFRRAETRTTCEHGDLVIGCPSAGNITMSVRKAAGEQRSHHGFRQTLATTPHHRIPRTGVFA